MNWQTTNPTSPNKLNHQQLPAIQLKQSGPRTSARFGRLLVWSLIGLGVVAMTTVGGNSWRARAQTNRFVSIGGDDQGGTNDCTTPDQPCATIQHAIEKSGSGDLIVVGPGTYVENVSVTVSVTIQGDGSASSMVDGNAAGPVFTINEGVTATLTQLTITNGNAQGSQSQFGGGVQNLLGANTTIVGCTINDNDATAGGSGTFGGGIGNLGTLTVINSTISGNSAPSGGGIANGSGGSTATATVVNSTIALNSATTGGGVDNKDTLNLTNTVIAGSVAGGDCVNSGTLATNLNNLIQDGSCSPAVSGNPKLGMLQNNGGPTFTHALLTGSPAIDAGDDSVLGDPFNLTTDQRGIGFPRKVCAHVDIGAYEFGSGIPPTITCPGSISVAAPGSQTTVPVSFTVTATDACGGTLTPTCQTGAGTPITSPFAFPVGVTGVVCSATDASGMTSVCSFTVTVISFPRCIQDDSSKDVFQFNPTTGLYQFTSCSTGFTLSGTAVVTTKGSLMTLQHNAPDRRVTVSIDNATLRATASIQFFPQHRTFTILDRNINNNTCACP